MDIEILFDVDKAIDVGLGKGRYNYKKIYPNTNENMKALFRNFSVEEKDVFSVLGSSDQVFTSFYLGAKSVDSFDINKLTIYYFYLRKWMITYLGEEYLREEYFSNNNHLIEFINSIKTTSEDEEKAKKFWLYYLDRNKKIDRGLFIVTLDKYDNLYKNDLDNLSKKIKNINFYNYDFSGRFILKKKYDVIILSNILECIQNPNQLFAARDNIERLLKEDGICVCSHLMEDKDNDFHKEEVKLMTMGNLIKEEIDDYYINNISSGIHEVGYVYKKRHL